MFRSLTYNWSGRGHCAGKNLNVGSHLQHRDSAATPAHGVHLDYNSVFYWQSELHNNKLPCLTPLYV